MDNQQEDKTCETCVNFVSYSDKCYRCKLWQRSTTKGATCYLHRKNKWWKNEQGRHG